MGTFSVGLIAHAGAGKTTLAEALLYRAGAIKKMGSVDDGTSVLDYEAEERDRKSSLNTALAHLTWEGNEIDLLDTPGSMNFIGATVGAIRVIEGALMVASAEPGIQGETEFLWEFLESRKTPRLMAINQMDREQANFLSRLESLNEIFGNRFVPVTLPIGKAAGFTGVVDLILQQAFDYANPEKPKAVEIPADMQNLVDEFRYRLVEFAAEGDDALLEKYLETESLEPDEILQGLVAGTQMCKIIPVYAVSGAGNIGTDHILKGLGTFFPDFQTRIKQLKELEIPGEGMEGYVADYHENKKFTGLVFKTKIDHYAGKLSLIKVLSGEVTPGMELHNPATGASERPAHLFKLQGKEQLEVKKLGPGELGALPKLSETHTGNTLCDPANKVEFRPINFPDPVLTYAFVLSTKGEEEKLASGLHRMMEEDATLSFHHNPETGDFLVSGMGQIHLGLVKDRLKREFGLSVNFGEPHVPYRETIRVVSKAQGKYKKQTGGRGQYGDCWLELNPNGQEELLDFKNAIVGGVIPRQFIPAVEKGVREALHKGILAGYPVIGINAKVYDGSFHDVDSSEMAFKIAASMAFKKAMEGAKPVILEPILELEIVVHADYMGDVMGDINARRGKVLGMDSRGRNQIVRAEVPMSEALTYAIDLRAMTSGQGYFTQRFSHYEEVPPQQADKIIKERHKESA